MGGCRGVFGAVRGCPPCSLRLPSSHCAPLPSLRPQARARRQPPLALLAVPRPPLGSLRCVACCAARVGGRRGSSLGHFLPAGALFNARPPAPPEGIISALLGCAVFTICVKQSSPQKRLSAHPYLSCGCCPSLSRLHVHAHALRVRIAPTQRPHNVRPRRTCACAI